MRKNYNIPENRLIGEGIDPILYNTYFYVEDISGEDNEVNIYRNAYIDTDETVTKWIYKIEYSYDSINWIDTPVIENTIGVILYLPKNKKLYFRGDNRYTGFLCFNCSKYYTVGGNILSINMKENFWDENFYQNHPTQLRYSECNNRFVNSTTLVDASKLYIPTCVFSHSYSLQSCFYGCSSLINPPNFSHATRIGSYSLHTTFFECSSLIEAPNMNNVKYIEKQGCYQMCQSCMSLTTMGDLSLLETIDFGGCTNMYHNCINLINIKNMNNLISIGQQGCQSMFNLCINIINPPSMNSLTFIDYKGCYGMFYKCSKLINSIDLSSVTKISNSGCNSMFQLCTTLITAKPLPSIDTIPEQGYFYMFEQCTGLVNIPQITSKTIENRGCEAMFSNCHKLNYIKTNFENYTINSMLGWLQNVSPTGTFLLPVGSSFADNAPRNASGIPEGWEIQYFNPETDEIIN